MDKQTSRKIIVCTIFFLTVGSLLVVSSVSAYDTVPDNGGFSGSLIGWFPHSGVSYIQSEGHNVAGSAYLNRSGSVDGCLSSTIMQLGTNSQLTYWGKRGIGDSNTTTYWVTTSGTSTNLGNSSLTTSWSQVSIDLAAFVGGVGFVQICEAGGWDVYVDDVGVSNAYNVAVPSEGHLNGNFYNGLWGWSILESNNELNYYANAGHNESGELRNTGGWLRMFISRPIVIGGSSWSTWVKRYNSGPSSYYVGVRDADTGSFTVVTQETAFTDDIWAQKTFNLGAFVGHRVRLYLGIKTGEIDDICPSTYCLVGTPTPSSTVANTPTASPTSSGGGGGGFPYGIGTPIPVDWQNFPTAIPYPTNQPYPTSMYGPGTPQPVIMFGGSPVPIQGGNTTPVLITGTVNITGVVRIDDRTPVSVRIAPDPQYTAVPYSQVVGQVSQASPGQGYALPTMIYAPSQSTIQLGQAGSSENPVRFTMSQSDITTPAVSFSPLGINFNVVIHYMYPSEFVFAGINILGGLYGLGAVFVLVFAFRQIQEK